MSIRFDRALNGVRKMQPDEIGQGYIDLAAGRLKRSREIVAANYYGQKVAAGRATDPARQAARVLHEAAASGALPARSAADAEAAAQLIDRGDGIIAHLAEHRAKEGIGWYALINEMNEVEQLILKLAPADDASVAALTAQRQLGRGADDASSTAVRAGQEQLAPGAEDEIVDAVVVG